LAYATISHASRDATPSAATMGTSKIAGELIIPPKPCVNTVVGSRVSTASCVEEEDNTVDGSTIFIVVHDIPNGLMLLAEGLTNAFVLVAIMATITTTTTVVMRVFREDDDDDNCIVFGLYV